MKLHDVHVLYKLGNAYSNQFTRDTIVKNIMSNFESKKEFDPSESQLKVLNNKLGKVENEEQAKALGFKENLMCRATKMLYECRIADRHYDFISSVYNETVSENYVPSKKQWSVLEDRIEHYSGQMANSDPWDAYMIARVFELDDLEEMCMKKLSKGMREKVRRELSDYQLNSI